MDISQTLLISAVIGLVVGFIIHAVMRYAQGPSLLATLFAGVIGAIVAVYYVAPNAGMLGRTAIENVVMWSIIGSLVLSIVVELLFVGTRRGRVVTS